MDQEFRKQIRHGFFGFPQVTASVLHRCRKALRILDVREPRHFDAAHIPGAVSASWLERERALEALRTFDRSAPLVIVGNSSTDAEFPVRMLQDRGFRCVAALRGGMKAYIRHGLPVVRKED